MKKFAALTLAVALLLGACGASDSEVAATVNGTEYTVGDVRSMASPGGDAMSKTEFAQFLGFLIQWDIVVAAAEEDYGVTIGDEEIADAVQGIYEANAVEGVSFEEFLEANGVSEEFINRVAQLQLIQTAVSELAIEEIDPPSAEDIQAQRDAAFDSLTEVCVAHILVETEEESDDLFDRIGAGEDFAELAAELSVDEASGEEGGDLGCSSPTRYVPGFMEATIEAEIDVPYGPVETEFGFHAVLVSERTFPEDDDLPTDEEIIESTRNSALPALLNTWVSDNLKEAVVTVSEKFGTWQASPPQVVPPSEDNDTTTSTGFDSTTTTTGEPTDTSGG